MNVRVETVAGNDVRFVERLVEIEKQAFGKAGLDEFGLVPLIRHGRVMALWEKDRIVGGAYFMRDWEDPRRAYLASIAVDRDHRGKGLGARFLLECLQALEKEGFCSVELTVDPANRPAVTMYEEKLGFHTIGKRKDEYGAGKDRFVMARWLTR